MVRRKVIPEHYARVSSRRSKFITGSSITTDISKVESNGNSGEDSSMSTTATGTTSPMANTKRKPVSRIPGGAAAKLFLIQAGEAEAQRGSTPRGLNSINSDTYDENVEDIARAMEEAKIAFEKGSAANRRYNFQTVEENTASSQFELEQNLSFLNQNELFPSSPAAAVASILMPRRSNRHEIAVLSDVSSSLSVAQVSSFLEKVDQATTDKLVTAETAKKLRSIESKMHQPDKSMATLLNAIASPEDRADMDGGFAVRRKNAVGALQLLTTNPKKCVRICYTLGVLQALTSVLLDASDEGVDFTLKNGRLHKDLKEARDRTISCLLNLAVPKDNRLLIFHTPYLLQSLIEIVEQDNGRTRKDCCSILALLGKSVENRLLMARVPDLLSSALRVLDNSQSKPDKHVLSLSESSTSNQSDGQEESDDDEDHSETSHQSSLSQSSDSSEESVEEGTPTRTRTLSNDLLRSQSYTFSEDLSEGAEESNQDTAENTEAARKSLLTMLGFLCKEKDNCYFLAREMPLLSTLVRLSTGNDTSLADAAVKILANLSRHPQNAKILVLHHGAVASALVSNLLSEQQECRLYACFALQNLSVSKECRQELALVDGLLEGITERAQKSEVGEEKLSAISTLKNLCDEPANLIPITNTRECIEVMMQLTHGEDLSCNEMVRFQACDGLASLSHWLRKLASPNELDIPTNGSIFRKNGLTVPSLKVLTWNQWQ